MTSNAMWSSLVVMLLLATASTGTLAAQDEVLTIHQDGRVLVRRSIASHVPRGVSTHELQLGDVDVSSVMSLDPDARLIEMQYADGRDTQGAMHRGVGRTFQVLARDDTLELTLLGIQPMRFRWPNGEISYGLPNGYLLFPADLVPTTPRLTLVVEAQRDRSTLELAYLRDGATWSAAYSVVFAEGVARMSGLAHIVSERIQVADADVHLMAGTISRVDRRDEFRLAGRTDRAMVTPVEPASQGVGDAHLYSLPQPVSLTPGETTTVSLFAPAEASYRRRYAADGGVPWHGSLRSQGRQGDLSVRVRYDIERPHDSDLGDRPIPGGIVRLYRPDESGGLQLIGETLVGHTPAGQTLDLDAGQAFDLTGKRSMHNYSQEPGERPAELATFEVLLTNAKDTEVMIDVVERRRGEWSVLEASVPWERVSADEARFEISVPAKGQTSFTYRMKAYQ